MRSEASSVKRDGGSDEGGELMLSIKHKVHRNADHSMMAGVSSSLQNDIGVRGFADRNRDFLQKARQI
jgi:hypothetical protein